LGTFAVALVCGRPRKVARRSDVGLDLSVFKDTAFVLLLVGSFFVRLGYVWRWALC
jgi:hypothetical protein